MIVRKTSDFYEKLQYVERYAERIRDRANELKQISSVAINQDIAVQSYLDFSFELKNDIEHVLKMLSIQLEELTILHNPDLTEADGK